MRRISDSIRRPIRRPAGVTALLAVAVGLRRIGNVSHEAVVLEGICRQLAGMPKLFSPALNSQGVPKISSSASASGA
mgnify:CR=1 FL=1